MCYLADHPGILLHYTRFLTYDPKKRITAEDALAHEYFKVSDKNLNCSKGFHCANTTQNKNGWILYKKWAIYSHFYLQR